MSNTEWFAVDRVGLRKLIESRPKLFLISELVSNAWDEASENVSIVLEMTDVRGRARLVVTDDSPSGFADLSHAYTMFAESRKKDAPDLRGRWNVGEKMALALCDEAEIVTTTGHVRFHGTGERTLGRRRTTRGSVFTAIVRMTRAELTEIEETIGTLIPPPGSITKFNGKRLETRSAVATFEAILPTVRSDAEGVLRDSERKTVVNVYEPVAGEEATIYELGIPVVASGDRFHVDVRQKVPLNTERNNVRPSYLRRIRTEVLNATFTLLDGDTARAAWVSEAIADKVVSPDAVRTIVKERYGERTVTADPFDREANARAVAGGFTVLAGGTFSADQWANIRAAGAAPVSTVRFATPSPLSGGPDAPVVDTLDPSEYTAGMQAVTRLARALAWRFYAIEISTTIVRSTETWGACYGGGRMIFNLRKLGRPWFDPKDGWTRRHLARVLAVLLHELAHQTSDNHLSDAYFEAIAALGGKLAIAVLDEPQLFEPFSADAVCRA